MGPAGKWAMAAAALAFSAGAAPATENIICSSADERAAIGFLVGTTPGLSPLSLTMDANGKSWATKPEGDQTAILIAQAFSDDEGMKIDITDDNAERIIAKLGARNGTHAVALALRAGKLR